jgi:hypothetical protein
MAGDQARWLSLLTSGLNFVVYELDSRGGSPNWPSCSCRPRQRNNLRALSFLEDKRPGAVARAAEPKILELLLIPTGIALIVGFYLRDEQPAVVESKKFRGALGIGTFVKHGSFRDFIRRLGKREFRSREPSLRLPSTGQEPVPL